jgi:hypothetical protein
MKYYIYKEVTKRDYVMWWFHGIMTKRKTIGRHKRNRKDRKTSTDSQNVCGRGPIDSITSNMLKVDQEGRDSHLSPLNWSELLPLCSIPVTTVVIIWLSSSANLCWYSMPTIYINYPDTNYWPNWIWLPLQSWFLSSCCTHGLSLLCSIPEVLSQQCDTIHFPSVRLLYWGQKATYWISTPWKKWE